ncbi:MAG: hypothetical protein PWP53_2813 [Lacrimispora sp.]|nr:hypothetical protein [Lacrimispora sp.]
MTIIRYVDMSNHATNIIGNLWIINLVLCIILLEHQIFFLTLKHYLSIAGEIKTLKQNYIILN